MKKKYCLLSLCYSLVFCLLAISCNNKPPYNKFVGFTQGTTFNIVYQSNNNYNKVIDSILVNFDSSLSNYNPNSILSQVNNNVDVVLDDYFIKCFEISKQAYEQTEGLFDPTINPLVQAYGFGSTNKGEPQNLSTKQLDSIMSYVGFDKVSIINSRVVKTNPNVTLDFNAIAQGLSVDIICDYLSLSGLNNYLVEIGGELYCSGVNPKGTLWRIGIDTPSEQNIIAGEELQTIIEIQNQGVATSGNYRKFINTEKEKLTHTIDPKTGKSATNRLLSATILTSSVALADAYATAAMVGGIDWTTQFVKNNTNIEAYLIFMHNDSIKTVTLSSN